MWPGTIACKTIAEQGKVTGPVYYTIYNKHLDEG